VQIVNRIGYEAGEPFKTSKVSISRGLLPAVVNRKHPDHPTALGKQRHRIHGSNAVIKEDFQNGSRKDPTGGYVWDDHQAPFLPCSPAGRVPIIDDGEIVEKSFAETALALNDEADVLFKELNVGAVCRHHGECSIERTFYDGTGTVVRPCVADPLPPNVESRFSGFFPSGQGHSNGTFDHGQKWGWEIGSYVVH